jgi:hypothetical protein
MIDVSCTPKRCSIGISAVDVSIAAGEIDRTPQCDQAQGPATNVRYDDSSNCFSRILTA